MGKHAALWTSLAIVLWAGAAVAAAPVTVSPGGERVERVASRCPTFSWTGTGAGTLRLVVYRAPEAEAGEPRTVIDQDLAAAATSWTPALDACLEPGGRYAWIIGGIGRDGRTQWSAPAWFDVPSSADLPDGLVEALEQRLALRRAPAGGAGPAAPDRALPAPAARPARLAASTSYFAVSNGGGVVASSFTGDGSQLTGLDPANIAAGNAAINVSGTAGNVTGRVAVLNGGTGATTASGARASLGAIGTADQPGGDLSSTYGNPVVSGLARRPLASTLPSTGQVLKWTGSQWAPSRYGNVRVVAKTGGDFTSIQAALNAITDASESNPYLIWVAPGVYAEQVTMKEWVDIEGSGRNATTITWTGGPVSASAGTVIGASNAELRSLTVTSTSGHVTLGIYINGTSPRITDLEVIAGPSYYAYGIWSEAASAELVDLAISISGATDGQSAYGVANQSSALTMTRLAITVTGPNTNTCYGVWNAAGSSPEIRQATISVEGCMTGYGIHNGNCPLVELTDVVVNQSAAATGKYGIYSINSSVVLARSTITAEAYGLFSSGGGGESLTLAVDACQISGLQSVYSNADYVTSIGASRLSGSVSGPGTWQCAGTYDAAYVPLSSTCR